MKEGVLYKCDPNKNTECKKTSCTVFKDCELTAKKEFSIDGIPLMVVRTEEGFDIINE